MPTRNRTDALWKPNRLRFTVKILFFKGLATLSTDIDPDVLADINGNAIVFLNRSFGATDNHASLPLTPSVSSTQSTTDLIRSFCCSSIATFSSSFEKKVFSFGLSSRKSFQLPIFVVKSLKPLRKSAIWLLSLFEKNVSISVSCDPRVRCIIM